MRQPASRLRVPVCHISLLAAVSREGTPLSNTGFQIRYSFKSVLLFILYNYPRSVTVSHSRDLQAPFTYWNAAPFAPGSSHTYRTFWKFLRTTLRPLRTDALDPTSSRALCLAEWTLILYYINFLQILMASTYSGC